MAHPTVAVGSTSVKGSASFTKSMPVSSRFPYNACTIAAETGAQTTSSTSPTPGKTKLLHPTTSTAIETSSLAHFSRSFVSSTFDSALFRYHREATRTAATPAAICPKFCTTSPGCGRALGRGTCTVRLALARHATPRVPIAVVSIRIVGHFSSRWFPSVRLGIYGERTWHATPLELADSSPLDKRRMGWNERHDGKASVLEMEWMLLDARHAIDAICFSSIH